MERLPDAADGTHRWLLKTAAAADAEMEVESEEAVVVVKKEKGGEAEDEEAVVVVKKEKGGEAEEVDAIIKKETYEHPPPRPPPPRAILYGPTGRRRSDMGYLSDEEREWLNDVQLRNAVKLLCKVPTLTNGKIRVWDAISVDNLLAESTWGFMQKKRVKAVLDGTAPDDFVIVQFAEANHWRLLVFYGRERKAIYWNPYGTALPRRHGLHARLAGFGWSVHSIRHALQPDSDDYQCGIWVHVILVLFLQHAAKTSKVSVSGFETAMAQQKEFKPIPPLGSERGVATRANIQHASAVRAELRAALWDAAVAGRLDGLNAQPEHLGARAGEALDVDSAVESDSDDDPDL